MKYTERNYCFYSHLLVSEENFTTSCNNNPEIYIWSSEQKQFEAYQTINNDVFGEDQAPLTNSKNLLSKSIKVKFEKDADTFNPGKGNSRRRRDVGNGNGLAKGLSNGLSNGVAKGRTELFEAKHFKTGNKNFVVTSNRHASEEFVDILEGDGNTVGSLKRRQRIIINNQRKNFISVGKLDDSLVLSISSKREKSMKLYRFDSKTESFDFYQQLPKAATSVKFGKVRQTEYMFFASPGSGFGLCPWLGVSGYEGCETLSSTNNKHVETITTENDAYVILGEATGYTVYQIVLEGNGTPYDGDVC